ncbi:hypothetical protein A2U01_0080422, partial [Trifolium medium]|nr:hypothetical protein [Trifolium medium]
MSLGRTRVVGDTLADPAEDVSITVEVLE